MMLKIGFLCSTEQFPVNDVLEFAVLCDQNKFDTVWFSDHFHPWCHSGNHATFAWVDIALALERTKRVQIGPTVLAPTFRYNPAVVAQAFATLDNIFPGRVFLGLGTGGAMNEVPVGFAWPGFNERYKRLEEAINIIQLLWTKDWVTYRGKYYHLKEANLYDKPKKHIPIYVAAFGPKVASLVGKYGDGLITAPQQFGYKFQILFSAIEETAKKAGRDPSKVEKALLIMVSYDKDFDKALNGIRFWGATLKPSNGSFDPRVIEQHANLVSDEELKRVFVVTTTTEHLVKRLESKIKEGFNHFGILGSGGNVRGLIQDFGVEAIQYLKETYGKN